MTDYQQAVIAALQALGKAVEWKSPREGRKETLRLDGADTDLELSVITPRHYLPGVHSMSWRARQLHEQPVKAAAMIVDRTSALEAARERYRKESERLNRAAQRRADLQDAFGDRARVGANHDVTFTPPLTPDQARAIVALLGKDITS